MVESRDPYQLQVGRNDWFARYHGYRINFSHDNVPILILVCTDIEIVPFLLSYRYSNIKFCECSGYLYIDRSRAYSIGKDNAETGGQTRIDGFRMKCSTTNHDNDGSSVFKVHIAAEGGTRSILCAVRVLVINSSNELRTLVVKQVTFNGIR